MMCVAGRIRMESDDTERFLEVVQDARREGRSDHLVQLGAELAAHLGVSEVGGDDLGLWLRFEVGSATYRMRWIWPGRFLMGSPSGMSGAPHRPRPVVLTHGLWLGEAQVTQALYQAVTGERPSRYLAEEGPVEQVSWDDATAFCAHLSERFPRLGLRLPTEAQWEYAARAGGAPRTASESHPWGFVGLCGQKADWCQDRVGEESWNWNALPTEPDIDPVGTSGAKRVFRGAPFRGGYFGPHRDTSADPSGDWLISFRLAGGHSSRSSGRMTMNPRGG